MSVSTTSSAHSIWPGTQLPHDLTQLGCYFLQTGIKKHNPGIFFFSFYTVTLGILGPAVQMGRSWDFTVQHVGSVLSF